MLTKKSITAVILFLSGVMIFGCQSTEKKVENAEYRLQNAKLEVVQAKKNLEETIQDSLIAYQKFKSKSEEIILVHEKRIAELKALLENEKIENRAEFEKKLSALEQKNIDLKKKLANYRNDEQKQWDSFRSEFIRDMEELGNALRDFVVKNN